MRLTEGPYGITIAIESIDPSEGTTRRQRESLAVGRTIKALIGKDAAIGHNSSGAPFLVNDPGLPISISHSRKHVAVAIGSCHAIGIDMEEWRPNLIKVAPRFLTPEQINEWSTPEQLLKAWTIKEALYKALSSAGHNPAPSLLPLPLPPYMPEDMKIHHIPDVSGETVTLAIIINS